MQSFPLCPYARRLALALPSHRRTAARGTVARGTAVIALIAVVFGSPLAGGCADDRDENLPSPDASVPVRACDPLDNTGCDDGEKCSARIDNEMPLMTTVTCVPAGRVSLGGICGFNPPGDFGFDDCAVGGFCLDGICAAICPDSVEASNPCNSADQACVRYRGIFDDRDLGICTQTCSPVSNSATGAVCDEEEGCYVRLSTGVATCQTTGALGQNSVCTAVNGCEQGLGCVLLSPDGASTLCTALCDTQSGRTIAEEGCEGALGPQAARPTCVAINQFYSDTPDIADEVGMCIDCAVPEYAALAICSS